MPEKVSIGRRRGRRLQCTAHRTDQSIGKAGLREQRRTRRYLGARVDGLLKFIGQQHDRRMTRVGSAAQLGQQLPPRLPTSSEVDDDGLGSMRRQSRPHGRGICDDHRLESAER